MIDEFEDTCIREEWITCLVSSVNSKSKVNIAIDELEGVWAMFATRKKDGKRLVYEVGHSTNIRKELNKNINRMYKNTNIQYGYFSNEKAFEWLDKLDCKYQTLIKEYTDITIYRINISQFLVSESVSTILARIDFGSINKIALAEILFAYLSKAICWHPGPKPRASNRDEQELINLEASEETLAFKLKQLNELNM